MTQTLLEVAADFSRQLSTSVDIGDTTASLNNYDDGDGNPLKDNVLYGFTADSGSKKEYIVALHIAGALSNIFSISRQGVATSGFTKKHRIGAAVEITDWALLSRITNILNGTTDLDSGTPLKYDGAPSQSEANALATVQFVLDTVSGGTVSFNPLIADGTAGENITDGDWVYLKESDGKWYKTDADDTAKCDGVRIGKCRATTTANNTITGGVFVYGTETVGSYSAGQVYYLSNTAGALATSAGTISVKIGVGTAAGALMFTYNNPNELTNLKILALAGGGALGTPSGTNKYQTQDGVTAAIAGTTNPITHVYTSSTTWSKPAGLKYVVAEVIGGGGGGGGNTSAGGTSSGGGAGGYSKKIIPAASLGSTETVTVGDGGTAGPGDSGFTGGTGGTSSFGSHLQATGGEGGTNSTTSDGGDAGVGSNGDMNLYGQHGGTANDSASGFGGSNFYGAGGASRGDQNPGADGKIPGGGGGGAFSSGSDRDGGIGARGEVRVTEYYA